MSNKAFEVRELYKTVNKRGKHSNSFGHSPLIFFSYIRPSETNSGVGLVGISTQIMTILLFFIHPCRR
jgi:hypothetical protein